VRAGMGTDAGDYDGSGWQSLVIGNFTNESMSLYRNDGSGLFVDEEISSGIRQMSLQALTFACFFFDYDLDGRLDIFAANGHVSDDISVVQPTLRYAQPAILFHNNGNRKFEDASAKVGPALQQPVVGRGAAYLDYDNDGDLDLVVTANNGAARLLRNENGNQNDMLRVKLVGTRSNRDGIGAKVILTTSNGTRLFRMVKTGSSYASQSELPLTFGLGKPEAGKTVRIEIVWPSGQKDSLSKISANQFITVKEGSGITAARPIAFGKPAS
jgi:enediyne biosynthesis protein E4